MDISSVLINAYSSAENHTALINRAYKNLRLLQPFEMTACGPSKPDDNHVAPRQEIIDGLALQHASTNPNQGVWLSRIAAFACRERSEPIRVLELGTCAGISAMYLLAGMSTQCGGKLTTFEGCSELAGLARQNLDEFIAAAKLTNVEYEVVVGPSS